MKFSVILQARMGSKRLPGKVMKIIDDKNPLIFYVISQLKQSTKIQNIVIATTVLKEDDVIEAYAKKLGVDVFRGDEIDVLDRYYNCAKKFKISNIIRITSDNPLIDPSVIDTAINKFSSEHVDFLTNCFPRTFPYGTEVEIFSFKALEKIKKLVHRTDEKEHVTLHFYNHPKQFKITNLSNITNLSKFRWTVDDKKDFNRVQKIIKKISKIPILTEDIINLISKKQNTI